MARSFFSSSISLTIEIGTYDAKRVSLASSCPSLKNFNWTVGKSGTRTFLICGYDERKSFSSYANLESAGAYAFDLGFVAVVDFSVSPLDVLKVFSGLVTEGNSYQHREERK